jgi:hypothetical protein
MANKIVELLETLDSSKDRKSRGVAADLRKALSTVPVWVAIVEHKHGSNFGTHTTYDKAMDEVAAFCEDWWEQEGVPGEMPSAASEIIEQYFAHVHGESYEVGEGLLNLVS